jgi:hypothetical protein
LNLLETGFAWIPNPIFIPRSRVMVYLMQTIAVLGVYAVQTIYLDFPMIHRIGHASVIMKAASFLVRVQQDLHLYLAMAQDPSRRLWEDPVM